MAFASSVFRFPRMGYYEVPPDNKVTDLANFNHVS